MSNLRLPRGNIVPRLIATAFVSVACIWCAGTAHAAIRTWDANGATPPNGSFNTAINWSSNTLPTAADTALFNLASVYAVSFSGGATSDVLQVDAGGIIFNSSSARTYNVITDLLVRNSGLTVNPNVTLNVGDEVDIGAMLGNGTVTVSGTNARLNANGASATHNIGGGGFSGTLHYENGAQGIIGGTLNVGVSSNSATSGQLNVSAGSALTTSNLRVGSNAAGASGQLVVSGSGSTLVQTGAATTAIGSGTIIVQDNAVFSTGTGNITIDAGLIIVGQFVATFPVGTFNANGDVFVNGGGIVVGAESGSSFNLAAGKTLTASNEATIDFNRPFTHFGDNTSWNIQSESRMNVKSLGIASNGGANNFATVTITGVGDLFQPTGIQAASSVTIGHASEGAAVVNLSNFGALFATGDLLIRKTGTVNITNSVLGAGNLRIDGGVVNVATNGGFLTSGMVTALNEAQIIMQFDPNEHLGIDQPWSILSGADVTSNTAIDIAASGSSSTVIIDGPGTTLTSTAGSSEWGDLDDTADVTVRNNAAVNVRGLILADETPSPTFMTSKGIVRIESGADMMVGGVLRVAVGGASTSGSVTVTGTGSTFTQSGSEGLAIGHSLAGSGTINVLNDGVFTTGTGPIAINATGTINVDGGTLNINGPVTNNGGTVNFTAGAVNVTGDLTVGSTGLLRKNTTLTRDHALTVSGTTTIEPFRTLTIDGSQFSTGALAGTGTLDFRRGALSITGAAGLTVGTAGPLGSAVTLGAGQTLNITNTATVQSGASLLVQTGGTMNAATLANNGSVTLDGANATLGGGTINNAGVLRGDGRVPAAVNNLAAGEIRAEQGKTLRFTGAAGPNNGRITMQGGALQFSQPLTNAATGVVSGRGTLFFDGGLTNQGKMQFSGGPTDIYGNVNFTGGTGGGEMINSGGSNVVTFYGNVTHNGDEIRTSPTNTTVFFGNVTGAGPFTGTGAARFEGTFAPGNSAALISFSGDVEFTSASTLEIEIGGLTPGTQHDRINIAGQATLDGMLDLSLINGFVPSPGDSFTVMTFGSRTGTFSAIVQPPMAQFNPVYSATDLVLVAILPTGEKIWAVDANGNTSVGTNWTGGVAPGGVGDVAVFGSVITAPRMVTVDVPFTVGRLDFNNANTFTISGANAITLDVLSGNTQINVINGSHVISAPVILADDVVINVAPTMSNLALSGMFAASGRSVTKSGAGTLTLNNVRAAGLSVIGGQVVVAPNGAATGASVLNTLTLAGDTNAWTSKLDVSDNDAVFQSTAANKAADFARLYNQLRQGFNSGDWLGMGITSASAATNTSGETGLSLVDNALLGYTNVSGQTVTADSILLKYTYYGDIDQNGQVDADDLTVFGNSFGRTSGATQVDGDIDFNGTVDADDLTVFGNNFNKGIGSPLATHNIQPVPEPSTLIVLLVATLCVATQIRPLRGAFAGRSQRLLTPDA